MLTDLATRAYNHSFKIDPIFRSMLDNDFYKLLMCQLIWKKHKEVKAVFAVHNRTTYIKIPQEIDISELKSQFDHARTIRLTKAESIWLRGNTFYGKKKIFKSGFIDWLENFSLPEYEITIKDNQYVIEFSGLWMECSLWEIPALSIINELRSRSVINKLSKFEIDIVYSRAKTKLWDKAERLRNLYSNEYNFKLADFGTRRRHSYLFQEWAVSAMKEAVGNNFVGTSNMLIAMRNDLEAIGTSAHELPMAYAAMCTKDEGLSQSPYLVLRDWADLYEGNLRVILPDAFGSKEFFSGNKFPNEWLAKWKGVRPDSMDYREAVPMILNFWAEQKVNPKEKLIILSDGMDIDNIEDSVKKFSSLTNISIGWGTNLTNDFKNCLPNNSDALKAISIVCKIKSVNGFPCVKLSDNPSKAMGPVDEIERYKRVFNYPEMNSVKVEV